MFFIKIYSSIRACAPWDDPIAAPALEGGGCWEVKPDGTVETKLSDKGEVIANYKITF